MRRSFTGMGIFAVLLCAMSLSACGLETLFNNAGHDQYDRPASKITGVPPAGADVTKLTVVDGTGKELEPFMAVDTAGGYELRLPSSKYSMLRVKARIGNLELRSIIPAVGEESAVDGVDLDARGMTEALIAEARLSADGTDLSKVTPAAYLGTRILIRAGMDAPGPTQELLRMVERLLTKFDAALSVADPQFFTEPELNADYSINASALDRNFLVLTPFDYVGDGRARANSFDFDKKLGEVAAQYRPAGCPDPDRIRVVFTANFNEGSKNGNCGTALRFAWAVNKPGKSMFFVAWIYDGSAGQAPSDINDPDLAQRLGSSTPNVVPMYDDGTNGDQVAGDNIWSIYFDMPKSSPGRVLRIGYKYTWGTSGAPWSGSEEWPGNSRILEVVDDNGDDFVYRHDVFGDEASNKDKTNLNLRGQGSIDWTTDLHMCGTPESHENKYEFSTCRCGSVLTPKWIGPLTVTCTQ